MNLKKIIARGLCSSLMLGLIAFNGSLAHARPVYCSDSPSGYHTDYRESPAQVMVYIDENGDGKSDRSRAFNRHSCKYCGSTIFTSGFPQHPYGYVGEYVYLSEDEYTCVGMGHSNVISGSRVYSDHYNDKYTDDWKW